MKKKPDRKVVAATLAFLVGAATAAVGPQAPRQGNAGEVFEVETQGERVTSRLPDRKAPAHFVVTGGS
jgi:hypothetical protein